MVLDCPGKWNSLLKMLQTFQLLVNPLDIAYKTAGETFPISSVELRVISDIVKGLKAVEELSKFLSTEDADIKSSDEMIKFTLQLLNRMPGCVSLELADKLCDRYMERRNTYVIQLMNFLENPIYVSQKQDLFGIDIDQPHLENVAERFLNRIFPGSLSNLSTATTVEETPTSSEECISMLAVSQSINTDSFRQSFHAWKQSLISTEAMEQRPSSIKELFRQYVCSKQLPPILKLLQESLHTIKPTSIDCERSFSVINRIVTDERCNLKDETIDGLMFQRHIYQKVRPYDVPFI